MAQADPFDDARDASPEELRRRLLALQTLIDRAPVPIAVAHDADCRTITANRALADLLGVPVEANISLSPPEGSVPLYRIQRHGRDVPIGELPMQSAIRARTHVRNEIEIVRGDGSVLYVQNDVEPLSDQDGRVCGCVSIVVDLTDRRRTELALLGADRRKDEFLATLSHELRNPLAPIRTAVELMRLARDNAGLVEKARATIERQLVHLVRITDDLLDVARVTQNKIELRCERLDLRGVLHGALEVARPAIEAQDLTLILDVPQEPLWAQVDSTRLAQALFNLLHNASKYTPRGGEVRVTARAAGGVASIAVADTGIGIPPEMLPLVFEMFTQVQSHRDRAQGGLGIGLTLARRLVELHGGTLHGSSEGPGRGSCFVVRLPLPPVVETSDAVERTVEDTATGGCRVLIADDNADAAEMMRAMLCLKGHVVQVAADGVQAAAIAEWFDPQVAFLDIGMPRMDGYEAARQIRARLGTRVLLVALTGWGQDEDKRRSRAAGFDHHLTKPPDPDILDRLIAGCAAPPNRGAGATSSGQAPAV
jgi:PAS domain S-box-containing protein